MDKPKKSEKSERSVINLAIIAEFASFAYASHLATCNSLGEHPCSLERFLDLYKSHIADFRRLLNVVDPNDPCG